MEEHDQEYRPDEDRSYEPYPYYGQQPKKKHTGLLVILAALALLTGAASWAVNVLGVRVDLGQDGMVVSVGGKTVGKKQEQPAQPSEQLPVEPIRQTQTPAMEETPAEPKPQLSAAETGLLVNESPESVENRPAVQADALSLQAIYEKVSPSVASISCVRQGGTDTGTGIVMSGDGFVITNYHVIENASVIYVLLDDETRYSAVLVGGDETTDLAVLKIDATGLTPAEFGDSDQLRVGDAVVAIGDPLGTELRGTMTDGIVSAINRDLNLSGRQMTLIQTNAALNSGNSGGPLINCYGQVVGITAMKISNYSTRSATVEGLGFAIPITAAKPIIDELIEKGYVSGRPAIGIQAQAIDLRAQFFYNLPSGVIVTKVMRDSDAAARGVAVDDVIVAVNGTNITSLEELAAAKEGLTTGDSLTLTICRGGGYFNVEIQLIDQVSADIY